MKYLHIFNQIKKLNPKKRGFEFEKLINKICDDQNILISNSYKTADSEQQIDGALEIKYRVFLLESKWEESSTLAASKLYSFLGKINSKIDGTLGVFISYNQLSDNFISSVRNGLTQKCVLIHGEDNIMDIINQNVNIANFIWYAFQQASIKNRSYVNTSEYRSLPLNNNDTRKDTSNWDEISKTLLNSTSLDSFIVILEKNYNQSIELSKKALNLVSVANTTSLRQEKFLILVKKCIEEEYSEFKRTLIEKLKGNYWKEFTGYSFLESIKDKIDSISDSDKNSILENATQHLVDNLGDYNEENRASELINFIFKHLSETDIKRLTNIYLPIYCDISRKDKFLQMKIAEELFKKLDELGKDRFTTVKTTIISKLEDEKREESFYSDESDDAHKNKENTINYIMRKFQKVVQEKDKNVLEQEYDKLK